MKLFISRNACAAYRTQTCVCVCALVPYLMLIRTHLVSQINNAIKQHCGYKYPIAIPCKYCSVHNSNCQVDGKITVFCKFREFVYALNVKNLKFPTNRMCNCDQQIPIVNSLVENGSFHFFLTLSLSRSLGRLFVCCYSCAIRIILSISIEIECRFASHVWWYL